MGCNCRDGGLEEAAAGLELNLATSLDPKLRVKVKSLEDASKELRKYVEENMLGGSDTRRHFGEVTRDGKLVARISYNGRIWGPAKWTPDSKVLSADEIRRINMGESRASAGRKMKESRELGLIVSRIRELAGL